MAGLGDWAKGKILDHLLDIAAWTVPTNYYAAAYTVAPADDGTGGTEVSGNGYARVAMPTNSTYFTRTGAVGSNALAITFPTATPSGWGTIVAIAWWDASTAGNLAFWGLLASSIVVGASAQLVIPAGDVDITVSGT